MITPRSVKAVVFDFLPVFFLVEVALFLEVVVVFLDEVKLLNVDLVDLALERPLDVDVFLLVDLLKVKIYSLPCLLYTSDAADE